MPSIDVKVVDIIQIVILSFALYYLTKSLYKTRAWILVKGLVFIGAIYAIICLTELTVLQIVMQSLFSTLMIAIIIMLQPELQRIVELIGKKRLTDIKTLILKKTETPTWYSEKTIYEITTACESMSASKTGALIVLERGIPLKEYINSGINLGSSISSQLLLNIFEKNTPLHDGAVIIANNKIESATCYLPLSANYSINKTLGTRHRAALGVAESTDCIVIVVSEETGAISLCYDGKLKHDITRTELAQMLKEKMKKHNELSYGKKRARSPIWIKILAPLLGIAIWASVVNTSDPVITRRIDGVQVEAINTEVLDNAGQTYTIQSEKTISVIAKGRRSLVDTLTKDDIIATADFTQMSIVYAVPIEISTTDEYDDVEISSKNTIIKVVLEEMIQTTIPVEVQVVGDSNNDYVVMMQDIETSILPITCSQSLAKTLDKAVLTIDAYGKETNFISTVTPVIYDKNGDKIDVDRVSLGQQDIRVLMSVYQVKDIPIEVVLGPQAENPDEYYVLNKYSAEFDAVRLALSNDMVGSIDKLTIALSPKEYGSGANSVLINLLQHIPEEAYLAKDQQTQMSIELDLTKYKRCEIAMPMDAIRVVANLPTNCDVEIISAPDKLEIYYDTKAVSEEMLTLKTISPFIRVTNSKIGVYDETLSLTDIDGVHVINDMSVTYSITEKRETP
jgi:diadenylate cyclase